MKILTILLGIILLMSFVSASTTYYNNTLETRYSVGEKVRGAINVSFVNVLVDALVETGWGDKIGLKTLLGFNNFTSPANYTCSPASCSLGYTYENALQSFVLHNSSSSAIGFVFEGVGVSNVDLSIKLTSNIGGSCTPNLVVDFGGTGTLIASKNYTAYVCGVNFGCFEQNRNSYSEATIPSNGYYCEKVNIGAAPAIKIGANVTNSTMGAPGLKGTLFALDRTVLGECTLGDLKKTKDSVECLIPYNNPAPKEYFACIQAKGNSNYKIRTEVNSPCGTNNFGDSYPIDYEIFVKTLAFGSPVINITKDTFFQSTGKNLADFVSQYISSNYGSCSTGCVIPLLLSGNTQQIKISNAKITYNVEGAQGLESTQVYNLSKKTATITSGQLIIDLGLANFTVPGSDNSKLLIKIGGDTILTKDLNITTTFSFSLTPNFVTYGKETVFRITEVSNITSAKWDFGDGTPIQTASGNFTKHTFLKDGNFDVSVEATRGDGKTSRKIFRILVGDIKQAINDTINKNYKNLASVEGNLSAYPGWLKSAVSPQLNITSLNISLNKIRAQYINVSNDTEYPAIYSSLIALRIPESIGKGKSGSLGLIAGADSIDTSYVTTLAGKQVDATALKGAITSWMLENSNAKIYFETITLRYASTEDVLATKFKIETQPKTSKSSSLFIGYPKNAIVFAGLYDIKEVGSATYIPLKSGNEVFEFVILDDVPVEQLGAYISPSLDSFGNLSSVSLTCNSNGVCDSGENSDNCSDCSKSKLGLYIMLAIVLALGIAAYFLLRWWYSRFYGQSLFKNKQDLANMIIFIINSKRAGMADADIKNKLKAAGWSSEKIDYAFKKVNSKS